MKPAQSALIFALVALASCATANRLPPNLTDQQALLAPDLACTIPTPDAGVKNVNVAQNIVVHHREQTFSLQAQIQINGPEVDLVALDNLGRRGMTVKWRDGHLDVTRAPWLPNIVRPADILTDIAVVFWPTASVAPALANCGAELRETADGRSIRVGDADVLAVKYDGDKGWNGTAHLHNAAFGFDIDIQSTDLDR